MRRLLLFMLPVVFISMPCHAQTDNDNLFSLDLSYALTSLLNHGWGIGLNYEKKCLIFCP
jgi:hypothetical protein